MMIKTKKKADQNRRGQHLQFRVSDDELATIAERATACGISCSEYLRRLGLGHVPTSRLDQIVIRELCNAVGDLGRLGGLLKLWISLKRGDPTMDGVPIKSIDALWSDLQTCARVLKERIAGL